MLPPPDTSARAAWIPEKCKTEKVGWWRQQCTLSQSWSPRCPVLHARRSPPSLVCSCLPARPQCLAVFGVLVNFAADPSAEGKGFYADVTKSLPAGVGKEVRGGCQRACLAQSKADAVSAGLDSCKDAQRTPARLPRRRMPR